MKKKLFQYVIDSIRSLMRNTLLTRSVYSLSDTKRKDFEKSGWHDTGLINGHGQPIVQNDKGKMLSVCRMPIVNSVCGGNK